MIRYMIWDVDGTLLDVAHAGAKTPFPGVRAVCDYIRSVGGDNFMVTQRSKQRLDQIVQQQGLESEFAECVTADDGLAQEPEPGAIEWIIGSHYLPRDEVLLIGNDELDILSGQAAGVRTCRFGCAPKGEAGADMTIESYSELYETLCAENGDLDILRELRVQPSWFPATMPVAQRA
jgi:phosphoglycolate phosphatase-like HAD superfamily hydrolase